MKRFAMLIAALGLAFPAAAEVIGFTGPYAPGSWTTAILGTLLGPSANAGSTTMTANTLTIVGGDADPIECVGFSSGSLFGPCEIRITTAHIDNPLSFSWTYSTTDISAGVDPFGVLVDGIRTALADPGGPLSQSGTFTVTATTSFGWFINCTDCIGGPATAVITDFLAGTGADGGSVPEPTTTALLGLGLAGVAALRRRRLSKAGAPLKPQAL